MLLAASRVFGGNATRGVVSLRAFHFILADSISARIKIRGVLAEAGPAAAK